MMEPATRRALAYFALSMLLIVLSSCQATAKTVPAKPTPKAAVVTKTAKGHTKHDYRKHEDPDEDIKQAPSEHEAERAYHSDSYKHRDQYEKEEPMQQRRAYDKEQGRVVERDGYSYSFKDGKLQLDINIHVDGAKDCQHVGYGPRYSADGDRYQSPRPMYDSYGPREQYEREPYRYRGSHEEQQPDSYNYAEEPGLHNRYSEYEQRAYGEGADHPYQHTYSYRHHEATNTYNFRALPGTEETTLAGGSTDNLPVIISYKAKLTCDPEPSAATAVGACFGTGIGASRVARQVMLSFTCTIDADASNVCGLKYVQGMTITAQGMVNIDYTTGGVPEVSSLQADVLPITGLYVPQPRTGQSGAYPAEPPVQYFGGSMMFRSDGNANGRFSFFLLQ